MGHIYMQQLFLDEPAEVDMHALRIFMHLSYWHGHTYASTDMCHTYMQQLFLDEPEEVICMHCKYMHCKIYALKIYALSNICIVKY